MNPSPFSSRPVLPGMGQRRRGGPHSTSASNYVRGHEVLWLGMGRPYWFLLVIFPLLLWRTLRVFGKPLRHKLEERAA
jgi:TRAP-type C4-dicarboxylate transport system permease small subunit